MSSAFTTLYVVVTASATYGSKLICNRNTSVLTDLMDYGTSNVNFNF